MNTVKEFVQHSMDDRAVYADDFFPIPLMDYSMVYEYDEEEMQKSVEKARIAREYCEKFEIENCV